jgi:hypothetical protein
MARRMEMHGIMSPQSDSSPAANTSLDELEARLIAEKKRHPFLTICVSRFA